MFYYLSFLRPPPSQVSPTGSFLVTPQVANDLRTELFDGSQDIYISWSLPPNSNDKPNSIPRISKPQKLTSWRNTSAYKGIPVPPPPGVKEGQQYRLVLTAHVQGNPHVINLSSSTIGERPFPVMSMPILFSLRGAKDKNVQGKQEHVERIYRIPTDPKSQVFMTVKEQTSFDLDKKVWDSGVGMSSWLVTLAHDQLEADASSDLLSLKDALFSSEPRDILELGAGTGIVSMTLGTLRHANQPPKSGSIMTTDLPSAMPSLEHNISANETLFQSQSSRPQALVLDWDNDQLPDEVSAIQGGFHAIIMADVTYNTSSFPALVRTLSNLVRLGTAPDGQSSRPPMILLGYKERDPAERSLWDMTREVGIQFEKVGERCGAGGDPVEIWIGTVSQTE